MEAVTPIGIIGAMDVEVALLRQAMEKQMFPRKPSVQSWAGGEFWQGEIGETSCVVVQSGVGMVNAAACTQALIDHFEVSAIINTGVAGSLDASLDIGDLVVATDAVNWVMDVCNLGYEPGQTPGMSVAFATDACLSGRLAAAARKAAKGTVRQGRIASADRFVRTSEEKNRISAAFGASCCEMEGAAIAQVCQVNRVPVALVRAISDKADGSDAMDYSVFEKRAAHDCAAVVIALLES